LLPDAGRGGMRGWKVTVYLVGTYWGLNFFFALFFFFSQLFLLSFIQKGEFFLFKKEKKIK
jgi:hypothetical protein